MKKMIVLMAVMFLAMPMVAFAVTGECVNCHTMHASKQNALDGNGPNANLLRYDCLGCHAQNPATGLKNWDLNSTGNLVPQVAHNDATDLAGGNFKQTTSRKIHSVSDITGAGIAPVVTLGENVNDQPPGLPHSSNRHVFTTEGAATAFDAFTCAGARGCHGTRSQALVAATVDNGTANNWEIAARRTGMAAISGAHHANVNGQIISDGYNNTTADHNGAIVGAGYRFIPGLKGYEGVDREYVDATNHNEYYGVENGFTQRAGGCDACHVQDTAQSNTRAGFQSGISTPNHSMSGFCSTCHGNFHSAGGVGANADYTNNGVSGAFLRHPSDYVIPARDEYALYTSYDPTAPVARPSVLASANGTVTPGTDMVMCLSCHVAHGSANDYLLRFDYTTMTSASELNQVDAQAKGGCMACHSLKGVTN